MKMARSGWERERIDPVRLGVRHGTVREHVARYRFAAERLAGRVLDAGCGTGYGSLLIAGNPAVREVIAVDCDERSIAHARNTYRAVGLDFRQADLLGASLHELGLFDRIVCLEVLEHLAQPERLLAQLDLCLAPGGRLIVSTPLGKGRAVPSSQPGHHFQLLRAEFEAMLAPRFRFQLFGQKGETIEMWRPGHRYFLMLAVCGSLQDR